MLVRDISVTNDLLQRPWQEYSLWHSYPVHVGVEIGFYSSTLCTTFCLWKRHILSPTGTTSLPTGPWPRGLVWVERVPSGIVVTVITRGLTEAPVVCSSSFPGLRGTPDTTGRLHWGQLKFRLVSTPLRPIRKIDMTQGLLRSKEVFHFFWHVHYLLWS